jgi:hypothetical protein
VCSSDLKGKSLHKMVKSGPYGIAGSNGSSGPAMRFGI